MRTCLLLFVTIAGLAQAPKGPASVPAPQPVATTLQVMRGIMLPAADTIFNAGNQAPKDDQGWAQVEYSALTIAECANLIMIGNRVKDRGNWLKFAKNLREAAIKTYQVAQKKDADALLDAGGELTEACDACHVPYRDQPRERAEKAGKGK